ncbi:MAG: PTS glucose transporter subunit IIA [Pseudoalteromonas sp.]
MIQFGILGSGIMVKLNKHKILAPFDGKLVQVKNAGTEFILQTNNGLKVLLNLYVKQSPTLPEHTYLAQINTSKITRGQQLAYFDLRQLKQPLLASLTILNALKNSNVFYSLNYVDAGEIFY